MNVVCLILAGGLGIRLRPLTWFIPKPLIWAGGKSRLIDLAVETCLRIKYLHKNNIYVLAGYQGRKVKNYVDLKYGISTLVEKNAAGTGGAIMQHMDFLKKSNPDFVLIIPADHMVNLPEDFLSKFHDYAIDMVLATVNSRDACHDYLKIDSNYHVVGFEDPESNKSNLAFTGIFAIRFSLLEERLFKIGNLTSSDLIKDVLQPLMSNSRVEYVLLKKTWADLGTWYRYISYRIFRRRE